MHHLVFAGKEWCCDSSYYMYAVVLPVSAPYYHWCTFLRIWAPSGETLLSLNICVSTQTPEKHWPPKWTCTTIAMLNETLIDHPATTQLSAFAFIIRHQSIYLYNLHDLWKCTFINRPSLFSHTLVSLIVFVLGPLTSPGVMVWSNRIYVIMAAVPSPHPSLQHPPPNHRTCGLLIDMTLVIMGCSSFLDVMCSCERLLRFRGWIQLKSWIQLDF